MKIFKTEQVKLIDDYTIKNEPVASIDLMERASLSFVEWFMRKYDNSRKIFVVAGPGNNGGDGLAIARMLSKRFFKIEVILLDLGKEFTGDPAMNKKRVEETEAIINVVKSNEKLPDIPSGSIIIDAIFGSGLTRKAKGLPAEAISKINDSDSEVVSVDIPSGLFGEDNTENDPKRIVRANYTISFEFPFLSFFFPENEEFIGEWYAPSIGLHPVALEKTETSYQIIDKAIVQKLIKKRCRFSHKGTFGHALFVAGCDGMMGAVVLGTRACLRTGAGLTTAHVPSGTYNILQTAVPEALISTDTSKSVFTGIDDLESYSAIGAGPALNKSSETVKALEKLLKSARVPLVLDADALNIISAHKELMDHVPKGTILTPHPKEFDRLFGPSKNTYQKHRMQMEAAIKYGFIIVLKGAYTMICDPEGNTWINSTGNPGMATGGSGDVLTGMILSLLAQGYSSLDASIVGVFIHGLAGDLALEKQSQESLIPGDIIEYIGRAFKLVDPHIKK